MGTQSRVHNTFGLVRSWRPGDVTVLPSGRRWWLKYRQWNGNSYWFGCCGSGYGDRRIDYWSLIEKQYRGNQAYGWFDIQSWRSASLHFVARIAEKYLLTQFVVIPIMRHQDTVGPMARSVADAAILLTVIAGRDILDNFTLAQPSPLPNYSDALQPFGLAGVRLGVVRNLMTERKDYVQKALNHSIDVMRGLGAEIVEADFANEVDIKEKSTEGQYLVAAIDFKVMSGYGRLL